jgi:hypothetical protein
MDILAAGPAQLDDWIQIIVILFVVVGSIFGALSKKLIERFTPKDAQRDDNQRSQATGGTEPPAQPAAPVARPLQPMSRLGPATQHPAARPSSPPPVTEHAMPTAPFPPPPRRARPRAPAAKRLPHPGHVVSEPAKAEQRLGHLTPVVELTGDREEVAAEQRLGHLETTIEDRDDRIEAVIEEHLGHGDTTRPTPYAQRSARRRVPVFGRATPQVLRQAVLMREILGPPIALRRDDERF